MNILAINPGHNGSSALVVDGKLELYIEEERMSRMIRDGNPYKSMIWIMQKYQIDTLVICGNGSEHERHVLPWTGENSYEALVRKFYPKVEVISFGHMHHLAHAASAFYGSGFDSAASLVVDGCGAYRRFPDIEDFPEKDKFIYFETESIYKCEWPDKIEEVWKRYGENHGPRIETSDTDADSAVTPVSYTHLTLPTILRV